MAFPSIQLNIPNPFTKYPVQILAPLTKIEHIPASQVLPTDVPVVLQPGQISGPLIANPTTDNQNIVLPSAQGILDVCGSNLQVQVGDYLILHVINIGAGQNTVTFIPGLGGSGSGSYGPGQGQQIVLITFTNVTTGSAAYTFVTA